MDTKASSQRSASAGGLSYVDRQIDSLFQDHLPAIPHIFFVPTSNPYLSIYPHENRNTPFEGREIPRLQYMTLISSGDRGVGASKGASDWEDEIYAKSPASANGHSSTSTPNPAKDQKKPSQKISFGDYKNYKQTGVKPSPKPYPATPEQRAGHSRNTSAVSLNTPMDRVSSLDGGERKAVDEKVSTRAAERNLGESHDRNAGAHSTRGNTREGLKSRPVSNGHQPNSPEVTKDSQKISHGAIKSQHTLLAKDPIKHALPPRPRSPPRSRSEHKKRPLESGESHPEKRAKIGHADSRNNASTQRDAPRKSETGDEHKPHSKSQRPPASSLPSLPKKPASSTNATDINGHTHRSSASTTTKPMVLPTLLSPLPADLGPSPELLPAFAAKKRTDPGKASPSKSPPVEAVSGLNAVTVKNPRDKDIAAASSPTFDSQLPFALPPMLSPGLPPMVEEELLRLQQKSASLTVEARHEKARRPDAPGVARKTPKNPKVGHPPKRHPTEDSRHTNVSEKEGKKSLIVKMPYRKRNAKDIQRILALKSRKRQLQKPGASEQLPRERSPAPAPLHNDSESEEEAVPLSKKRADKAPAVAGSALSKKRPSDFVERNESAPKRVKPPDTDTAKTSRPITPAFKSPAPSNPSVSVQNSLLATPKKGDALRNTSSGMRRVDSNDGSARTPQTISNNTPASVERHRTNGIDASVYPELDKQTADEAKFFPIGTTLKRKMDPMLFPKTRNPSGISDPERKAGLCIGVESLMAYMLAFHARDCIAQLRSKALDPMSWDQFMKLQVYLAGQMSHHIELQNVVDQMGALAREMLNRAYMEQLVLVKDVKGLDKIAMEMRANSRATVSAWMSVKRNEKVLRELGVRKETLGPWSSVHDAVALAEAMLAIYTTREKLEWSPDEQLTAAREGAPSERKDRSGNKISE